MKRIALAVLAVCIAAAPAFGQETRLRSARVSAPDVVKTATFYKAVFGLQEIRKVDREGAPFEVIMNYGKDVKEAEASKATKLVVILRAKDAPAPSVSNLVFEVKDLDGVIAKAVKAGGTLSRPVNKPAAGATSKVGFVKDPAGNEIELIEPLMAAAPAKP